METEFITLTEENIDREHICCAFSDKKCTESYQAKKAWMKREFDNGYIFRRLPERAKVFIEYSPAEKAWIPVDAPNYFMIHCFWVSGKYKGKGYAKALLQTAIDDARAQGKDGIITVVGTKKLHFMSDAKWFLKQGFETVEKLPYGFSLLVKKLNQSAKDPSFRYSVQSGECPEKNGIVVYYTNRCPFTEYYVNTELTKTAEMRKLPLKLIKLETMEQAQSAPTPATIFSLFYDGKFVTTDMSSCMDSKFEKTVKTR
ncbi:MAG: GNAT family N-acetyltransferase [Methanomicrobiales archaeon]|jgi:GNAT superfamily N-acetyltransferase|nr:GNAT family N-acetyltransferase [Methanomicrobiales archaeon]